MRPPVHRRRHARAAAALLAIVIAGGCGGEPVATDGAGDDTAATTAVDGAVPTAGVTVHFLDDAGRLVAERRTVRGPLTVESALSALAEGPRAPGLAPALPPGTVLRGARVDAGTATADFSRPFESAYPPGGAAAELAVLAPVVYTATAVPGVRRVRITVEGGTPMPVGSQVDLTQPLTRADLPVTVVRRA